MFLGRLTQGIQAKSRSTDFLGNALQAEADALFALVFLLLDEPRLLRQQLAERQIGRTKPVDLPAFDVLADVSQGLRAPSVQLLLVLAHVLGQDEVVVVLGIRFAQRFFLVVCDEPLVMLDPLTELFADFLSCHRQLQAFDHLSHLADDDAIVLRRCEDQKICKVPHRKRTQFLHVTTIPLDMISAGHHRDRALPHRLEWPTALAFYRDRLGFAIMYQGPEPNDIFFGMVERGAAMIMLKEIGVDPVPNHTREVGKGSAPWDAYIAVSDPDALAAEFASRDVQFSQPLKDTSDGLRGFEVTDVDGYVLFFGRPNRKA